MQTEIPEDTLGSDRKFYLMGAKKRSQKGKLIAVEGATISCLKSTVLGIPTSNFLTSTSDIETCCCNDSILTINDDGVGVNIRPFQGCSVTPSGNCTPIPLVHSGTGSAWRRSAKPFADIEERILTEKSFFKCTIGNIRVKILDPGQEDLRVGDEFEVCRNTELSIEEARVRAFLRMIQVGEGTLGQDGYETLFGGESFIDDYGKDFSDHPNIVISAGGYRSSAAGSYQILNKTWESYAHLRDKYGIEDFSPLSQDLFGVALVGDVRRALDEVMAGDIEGAIRLTNREWASLPESPYGQPTTTMTEALEHFDEFLAEELDGQTTLHLPNGFLEDYGFVDP